MDEHDLRELVNPVFNTARSCVQLIAATGDEDAQRLVDALGFESFGTRASSSKNVPEEMHEQVKKLFPAYSILIETRFNSMNQLIERREDRTIVDLPCGYTSRGIRLSRQGRAYFGCDLPAVVDVMGPAVDSIIGKDGATTYHAVDATNYESLVAALTDDARNLLITTEGLLMYFDQSELEEVFSNIRRLLQERGGSWVVVDRTYFQHDKDVVVATLNNDPQLTALFEAVTSSAAATAADVEVNNNVIFDPDDAKVEDFIGRMGFKLSEVCMADYLPEQIVSVAGNPEADSAVRDVFKEMMFWELTVAEGAAADEGTDAHAGGDAYEDADAEPVDPNLPFEVVSAVRDGTFEVSVQGRVDTITAPEVLKQFKDAGGDFKEIHLDVSRMSYVSSAGLRVLMIMRKSLGKSDGFKMTGVSRDVRKILEMSGMDWFLLGGK